MWKFEKDQPSPSSLSHRRNSFELILGLLNAAKEGQLRTHLAIRAGVSYAQLQKYLDPLLQLGLIQPEGSGFKTTEDGRELATKLQSITTLLEVNANAK